MRMQSPASTGLLPASYSRRRRNRPNESTTESTTNVYRQEEREAKFNRDLFEAARRCDLTSISEALAKGGSVDWKNEKEGGKTALHVCVGDGLDGLADDIVHIICWVGTSLRYIRWWRRDDESAHGRKGSVDVNKKKRGEKDDELPHGMHKEDHGLVDDMGFCCYCLQLFELVSCERKGNGEKSGWKNGDGRPSEDGAK
ncbi:hypothetical protein HJC23_007076 [Cyclotella cryptica]|uniref:Uncharacterized protein n=1 Tax=Cyclotella cryptica TaxID=29204 RepID=A0ABD3PE29_9STRA